MTKIIFLIDNHYKSIYGSVRSECSSRLDAWHVHCYLKHICISNMSQQNIQDLEINSNEWKCFVHLIWTKLFGLRKKLEKRVHFRSKWSLWGAGWRRSHPRSTTKLSFQLQYIRFVTKNKPSALLPDHPPQYLPRLEAITCRTLSQ